MKSSKFILPLDLKQKLHLLPKGFPVGCWTISKQITDFDSSTIKFVLEEFKNSFCFIFFETIYLGIEKENLLAPNPWEPAVGDYDSWLSKFDLSSFSSERIASGKFSLKIDLVSENNLIVDEIALHSAGTFELWLDEEDVSKKTIDFTFDFQYNLFLDNVSNRDTIILPKEMTLHNRRILEELMHNIESLRSWEISDWDADKIYKTEIDQYGFKEK